MQKKGEKESWKKKSKVDNDITGILEMDGGYELDKSSRNVKEENNE